MLIPIPARLAAHAGLVGAAAAGALVFAPAASSEPLSGVAALQVALHSRGLYPAAIDGLLGPKTIVGVRKFQRRQDLVVDGIPGPATRAALGRYGRYRLGARVLTYGDFGWDVAETQFLLRAQGYKPGPLDGSLGTHSEIAIRKFQRAVGLDVDGVVGPATLASLDGRRPAGRGGLAAAAARRARKLSRLVIIRRKDYRLYFYRHSRPVRVFTVTTGSWMTPSPRGRFRIVAKYRHPWWYPPHASWARHLKPIPPGPGNPLGTRWMGISVPGVGIHGTPDAASLGYSLSHGCIRMSIRDAESLFRLVRVGTPVWIY